MPPKTTKVNDEFATLLSEVEIGGYTIKPWSFGKFKKISPMVIGHLVPSLKAMGMTSDNFGEILANKGPEIMTATLLAITPLIAGTLDITEAEVDEMDFDQGTAIGLTIISQNLNRIKNSWPLIMEQVKAMIRAT